jgi:hypothetical protein
MVRGKRNYEYGRYSSHAEQHATWYRLIEPITVAARSEA